MGRLLPHRPAAEAPAALVRDWRMDAGGNRSAVVAARGMLVGGGGRRRNRRAHARSTGRRSRRAPVALRVDGPRRWPPRSDARAATAGGDRLGAATVARRTPGAPEAAERRAAPRGVTDAGRSRPGADD